MGGRRRPDDDTALGALPDPDVVDEREPDGPTHFQASHEVIDVVRSDVLYDFTAVVPGTQEVVFLITSVEDAAALAEEFEALQEKCLEALTDLSARDDAEGEPEKEAGRPPITGGGVPAVLAQFLARSGKGNGGSTKRAGPVGRPADDDRPAARRA
jgi:hypothetical protein